jgi:hypothetical protein
MDTAGKVKIPVHGCANMRFSSLVNKIKRGSSNNLLTDSDTPSTENTLREFPDNRRARLIETRLNFSSPNATLSYVEFFREALKFTIQIPVAVQAIVGVV